MVLQSERSVELPLLRVLADNGGQLPMLEAVDKVTGHFPQITPEDLAGRLKIGVSRWRNSVQWTRQRLIMKGELDGSVRGIWKITDKGRARLEKEWSSWIPKYRKQVSGTIAIVSREEAAEQNPQEVLEDALEALNQNLQQEILGILLTMEPPLFESVIGELLEKMGYGDVRVTGRSGDGGIDGHRSVDALGLVKVHFQAKRWKNSVGAKEIRDFIGGIQTKRGERGIFVTTSDFTDDAVETAEKAGSIRLVKGAELARLMTKYGLGVTKTNLESAKLDRDYFEGL